MKQLTSLAGVLALSLVAACGGPGSVNGTVSGHSLAVSDAVYADINVAGGIVGVIFLSDHAGMCDEIKANRQPKNLTYLAIALTNFDASHKTLPLAEGEYTVSGANGMVALVNYNWTDSSCQTKLTAGQSNGKSGLIKLTHFSDGTDAAGTFDVTIGSQNDHVTGSFDAPNCNADLSNLGGLSCE